MVTPGKVKRDFTSPAGAMTLLLASGWPKKNVLLKLMELTRHDGLGLMLNAWGKYMGRYRNAPPPPPPAAKIRTQHYEDTVATLERWLLRRPAGPLDLGWESIETMVAAACCWSTAITHSLSGGPMTFEEIRSEAACISKDGIVQEHLDLLVRTGQAERFQELGQPYRYRLTDWGAEFLAPLIAAVRYESRLWTDEIMEPEIIDVESTFKIAANMLRLPPEAMGSCHLCVSLGGEEPVVTGARVDFARGEVLATSTLLETNPKNWVRGTSKQWCEAVYDPAAIRGLQMGGDVELAEAILSALHVSLFGNAAVTPPPDKMH